MTMIAATKCRAVPGIHCRSDFRSRDRAAMTSRAVAARRRARGVFPSCAVARRAVDANIRS